MLPQSDQSEAANIVYFYDIVYFKSNIRRVSKLADFELVFFRSLNLLLKYYAFSQKKKKPKKTIKYKRRTLITFCLRAS